MWLSFFASTTALILNNPKKVSFKTPINLTQINYKITLISTKTPRLFIDHLCLKNITYLMEIQNFPPLYIKNKAFMNKKHLPNNQTSIIVLLFIQKATIKPLKIQDRTHLFLQKHTIILCKMGATK